VGTGSAYVNQNVDRLHTLKLDSLPLILIETAFKDKRTFKLPEGALSVN